MNVINKQFWMSVVVNIHVNKNNDDWNAVRKRCHGC